MNTLGIIPARYASSRFPGKPLADIHGKPMIQRVYEQCKKAKLLNELIVATDDIRISQAVKTFGGRAMMTGIHHRSGTDRCTEVLINLEKEDRFFDVVVNIQGDEPYINPGQIGQVLQAFVDPDVSIATLAKKIQNPEELFSYDVVKVIRNKVNRAIYFGRQPLPFQRNVEKADWLSRFSYLKHVGLYAYRSETLKEISGMDASPLEKAESLEQLRWLENGYSIYVGLTEFESIAVDKPEDLSKFTNMY